MRSLKGRKQVIGGCLAALVAGGGLAFADAPAAKWYDSTSITGYVQGSYVGNLSKDVPQTNQLRGYDANNGFTLNQAQIHVAKPVADDGYGFSIKLLAGHDASIIHSYTGGTESASFDLEEANVTFNVPRVKGLQFTGGKFTTMCGEEVIESPLNYMIAPGYLFFFGMPFTHTGAKLTYAVSDKLSVMGGLVNGWDNLIDNNPGKTVIWQFIATPVKTVTASFQGTYGPEMFGTTNVPSSGNLNISKRTHTDFVLGYTGINKLSLNAEYLWGQDSNIGGTDNSGKGVWSGAGLWASFAQSDMINPSVRFEVFRDQNSAGRLLAGTNQTAKDIAVNNKFNVTKNTAVRVEFRHDWSNAPTFTRNDGTMVKNQNTISADYVVTF